jgi:hypothetical protein
VLVYRDGRGALEGCLVYSNARAGVEIRQHSRLHLRHDRIHDNGCEGLHIHGESLARVEHCDLSGNAGGASTVEAGSQLHTSENQG